MIRALRYHLGASNISARASGAAYLLRAISDGAGSDGGLGNIDVLNLEETTLVSPPSTCWGPASALENILDVDSNTITGRSVAVVRSPFTWQNRGLSEVMRKINKGQQSCLALSKELLRGGSSYLVVDEYLRQGSSFVPVMSTRSLPRFLREKGIQPVCVEQDDLNQFHSQPRGLHNAHGFKPSQPHSLQSTNSLLMVAPTAFGYNEEAANDNKFMNYAPKDDGIASQVLKEFHQLYYKLTEKEGIQVHLFQHGEHHGTPDAVFPNNWFTTHSLAEMNERRDSGCLVLYPLKCLNRRKECRKDILQYLETGVGYSTVVDFRHFEKEDLFLEGTGSLVLDRVNKVAYVAVSERADVELAREWAMSMGYKEVVFFTATDSGNCPVYHTNVVMAIGTEVAIVCTEAVEDPKERKHLLEMLKRHHYVVEITRKQMNAFCGNVMEVVNGKGDPVLAMSTQAFNAFDAEHKDLLRKHVAGFVHSPIDTLERVGGGGVRCTLAELF